MNEHHTQNPQNLNSNHSNGNDEILTDDIFGNSLFDMKQSTKLSPVKNLNMMQNNEDSFQMMNTSAQKSLRMKNELTDLQEKINNLEMKLSEMDEWMVGVNSVVKESGVWRFLLDDDMNIIEGVKVDSVDEEVSKYSSEELGYEFWVSDKFEYYNINVEGG